MDGSQASPAKGAASKRTRARPRLPAWAGRAGEAANRLASSKIARTAVTIAVLAIARVTSVNLELAS